jgi:PAS domain S-box-containing protein
MSSRALESILQASPDLLFHFDRKGNFINCFNANNKLLLVPPEQIKGKNLRDFFDHKTVIPALACIEEAVQLRREASFEYELIVNHSVHHFEARMVPIENEEVVSFIRDVTDRHLLQRKNDELVKINDELDSFIYRASHDLRAPLSSILGLTEIGLRSGKEDDMKSCLSMIKERVEAQDQVIHDIIDYARNLRTDVINERFNLKLLIFEVIDTLLFNEGADKIDFQIQVADDLEIDADKMRLTIILSNLLSNAVKYHDSAKNNQFVRVTTELTDSTLTTHIEDNGLGIPGDQQDKIFNMFYRASEKSKGSGLGLFIVKDTLEKLRGTIEFVSTPGKGSRFTFVIPH